MRRTIALMGAAHGLEYAAQLLLPVLLVRLLTPEEFGGYRIAWLLAQTAVTALTLNLAHNLVYQVARQPSGLAGVLMGNALAYLTGVGLLAAALLGPVGALAATMLAGEDARFVVAFVFLWVVSQPLDSVALMLGRPLAQARLALLNTALRVVTIAAVAAIAQSLDAVLLALAALAALRLAMLVGYLRASAAAWPLRADLSLARWQLLHAFGFGVGASLFALRLQVDGWIAALAFDPFAVALISIAATLPSVVGVARTAVTNAITPGIAQAVAQGRLADAIELNRRANVHVCALLAPLIAVLIVVAPDLLSIVFTPQFEAAATPLRLYLFGYAAALIETSTLIQALGYGRFVLLQGAVLLGASGAIALAAAHAFGVAGIALGAAATAAAGALVNLAFLARRQGVRWRDLQSWPLLARLVAAAALAATAAALALTVADADSALARLGVAGLAFGLTWVALVGASTTLRPIYLAWLGRRPALA